MTAHLKILFAQEGEEEWSQALEIVDKVVDECGAGEGDHGSIFFFLSNKKIILLKYTNICLAIA